MSASSCLNPAAGGGFTVITHISPACPAATGVQRSSVSRNRTLALGTVQIMIGLVVFLFGLASLTGADSLGVYSGIFVWGAFSYVVAGSLSVAAASSTRRSLVNGALGTNIVAAIFSCTATILYSLDAAGIMIYCYNYNYYYQCDQYMSRVQGMSGVLAIFNVLEFIVSICVAGIGCSATCCSAAVPHQVVIYSNNAAGDSVMAQAPPTLQAPPAPHLNTQMEKPPEYSSS